MPTDLLILTALTEEAQVVAAVLAAVAQETSSEGDVTFYDYQPEAGVTIRLATASAHQMGAVGMGVFAAPLFERLKPKSATLVGIAAAVDVGEVDLGDVPFASQVLSYDDIAVQDGILTFRTEGYQVDPRMRKAAGKLRMTPRNYTPWREHCIELIPKVVAQVNDLRRKQIRLPADVNRPHLVVEPVAGGPFLLRDRGFRDALRRGREEPEIASVRVSAPVHPKLVSAEMESHGFMRAAHEQGVPATVIKGISDVGDDAKAALEKKTGGFYRTFACCNALLVALRILWIGGFGRDAQKQKREASVLENPMAAKLADAVKRYEELDTLSADTKQVREEILDLKRKLRDGGQLKPGDILRHSESERYVLVAKIGQGGFAAVWRAYDRVADRDVAIKVLHGQYAQDRSRRERFFTGARVMAQLDHVAIVRVLFPQLEDGGFHYFVMEYIDGLDFRRAMLNSSVKVEEVGSIMVLMSQALAAAHDAGFVHRDVKPANILLGRGPVAKLTDFDLVTGDDITGGTRTGAMGTWRYAAPEVLDRPQDATFSADVYGLGMTIVFALRREEIPRSAVVNIKPIIDSLCCGPILKDVIRRAVEVEPTRRFKNGAELAEALSLVRWPDDPSMSADDTEPVEFPRDRLLMVIGPAPGKEFVLVGDRLTIGRSEEANISINHTSVSRLHADLMRVGDSRWELTDRGSANGIHINGTELHHGVVEAGDLLRLGDVRLKFVAAGKHEPRNPPQHVAGAPRPMVSTSGAMASGAKSNISTSVVAAIMGVLFVGLILFLASSGSLSRDSPAATGNSDLNERIQMNTLHIKALEGDATEDELRMLKELCIQQDDRSCHSLAEQRLKELVNKQ